MAARSRLILRQIHWSLLVKGVGIAALWYLAGIWGILWYVALFIALRLFFIPLGNPFRLLFLFVIALVVLWSAPLGLAAALFLAVLFYLIFGIKDFVFVDRGVAYEITSLLIFFVASLLFFVTFESWENYKAFFYLAIVGALFFFLVRGVTKYKKRGERSEQGKKEKRRAVLVLGAGSLLLVEIGAALLFVPMSSFYQATIFFTAAFVLIELLPGYLDERLTRERVLVSCTLLFLVAVFVLAESNWGL